MAQHCLLLLLLIVSGAHAQDERYYRQILSGELPGLREEVKEPPKNRYDIIGSSYRVDLDGDGIEENLIPQKRDGVDWLEITNHSKRKLFEAKLFAMGAKSVLYKVRLVQISPKVKALLLYLDEGHTAGRKFESTARLYVISFENNSLDNMKMVSGPHFYHEREAQRDQYWRRDYEVNVHDINDDGVKEIAVQFNHIQRIMKYEGNGEWSRL